MEFQSILEIIGTYGFPIAAYIGLFWYIIKKDQQHKEETDKFTEALNKNTNVLVKLAERLGGDIDE